MNITLFDFIGIVGTTAIAFAYLLQQLGKLQGDSLVYLWVNLIGAILLMISLYASFNLASFLMEIFWITASLIGLWKYHKARKK